MAAQAKTCASVRDDIRALPGLCDGDGGMLPLRLRCLCVEFVGGGLGQRLASEAHGHAADLGSCRHTACLPSSALITIHGNLLTTPSRRTM